MTAAEIMRSMVFTGEIKNPESPAEIVHLMDRFVAASSLSEPLQGAIESYKDSLVNAHSYKSGKKDWAYISMLKQATANEQVGKLDKVVFAVYGVDLITYSIQQLIVDNRIKLNGKKVYLVN